MHLNWIGKITVGLLLAGGLAGCVDVDVDIAVTGSDTARTTLTQTMDADFYAMVKMSADEAEGASEGFCDEGTLTETSDGGAVCVVSQEGDFASLDVTKEDGGVTFESAGPGLVRVTLPTKDMQAEVGADEDMDAETRQMVEAFFAGRTLTIKVAGAEVVETNMTISADKSFASQEIMMLDLINGAANLPEELFAVVRTP